MNLKEASAAVIFSSYLVGCNSEIHVQSRKEIFSVTLYRSSPLTEGMRIHIATFDTNEGLEYNRDNCELARKLFQQQPGVLARFWCEKGLYSPN